MRAYSHSLLHLKQTKSQYNTLHIKYCHLEKSHLLYKLLSYNIHIMMISYYYLLKVCL